MRDLGRRRPGDRRRGRHDPAGLDRCPCPHHQRRRTGQDRRGPRRFARFPRRSCSEGVRERSPQFADGVHDAAQPARAWVRRCSAARCDREGPVGGATSGRLRPGTVHHRRPYGQDLLSRSRLGCGAGRGVRHAGGISGGGAPARQTEGRFHQDQLGCGRPRCGDALPAGDVVRRDAGRLRRGPPIWVPRRGPHLGWSADRGGAAGRGRHDRARPLADRAGDRADAGEGRVLRSDPDRQFAQFCIRSGDAGGHGGRVGGG